MSGSSPVDSEGRITWSKADIDLMGQVLMDEFAPLWKKIQQVRTQSTLSLKDLDELMQGLIGVGMRIENLKERARYVRRTLMTREILRLLGRPQEEWEKAAVALAKLTDKEIKELRDTVERNTVATLEALKGMLTPDARKMFFG